MLLCPWGAELHALMRSFGLCWVIFQHPAWICPSSAAQMLQNKCLKATTALRVQRPSPVPDLPQVLSAPYLV
jgi:hypothetical protein